MVNKELIGKIISILMVIDLGLGIFFLAFLMAYTLDNGGGLILTNPFTYVVMVLLFAIPIFYWLFYGLTLKEKEEEKFIFNRATYLENKQKEKNKHEGKVRFANLDAFDKSLKEEISYEKIFSLKDLCDDFRNFCASDKKNPLYYSIEDIRAFISNLATSKIMVLQGMSGTGKTSIALAFERYVNNVLDPVAIQPMWKERSDLIGYFNEFTKKFNETLLLEELYKARFSDKIFIIILDEMNIARVEYYFAEFLSKLEVSKDQRLIEVANDSWPNDPKEIKNGKLLIGSNVYFLGTANNDESTFAISDKVYDRATILNLDKKADVFIGEERVSKTISNTDFENICEEAINAFHNSKDEEYVLKVSEFLSNLMNRCFKISFGNRIMNQLLRYIPVYLACGGKKEEALDDFVTKKILRKIESKDFLKLNDSIKLFFDELDNNYGEESFKKMRKYLSKFITR